MKVPGDLVLVAGATGGVGQILTAKLLEVRTLLLYISGRSKPSLLEAFKPKNLLSIWLGPACTAEYSDFSCAAWLQGQGADKECGESFAIAG